MRLETELAQMNLIVLNSDHFGLVLLLETKEITWDHHPVSLNNQWKRLMGWLILWGLLSHTSISRGNNSPSGWASLLCNDCQGSRRAWSDWTAIVWAAAGRQDDPHPEWQHYDPRKYYDQIWTHCISPPHVCLLIKKTKSSFSFLFNVCDPWHKLYQVAVNQISTKSVLETMALLGLLCILGIVPQFPSSKERLPTLWSTKYNLGPAVLY